MDAENASPNLNSTFGAAYVGAMVMMILYGITCLQTYFFFIHYPKDSAVTKLLVMLIWVLDTFHVALVSHSMYFYLVTNFNNAIALQAHTWSLCLSLGLNVIIAFVVQSFFTHKIHGLSGKNWWITGITLILVVAHFAFGMEAMVFFFVKNEFHRLPEVKYVAALPFGVSAVLSDIAITAALCYLLQMGKTSFRSTNALLNALIIYAINRCLVVAILAIVEVIVFVTLPKSLWFLAIDFVIGKCYANSLLATLNSRLALRGKGLGDTEMQSIRPEFSTTEGLSPTALEIAGVTPSMISRSRMNTTQAGQMAMSFSIGNTSRTSATRSSEVKEIKPQTEEEANCTDLSPERLQRRRHSYSCETKRD